MSTVGRSRFSLMATSCGHRHWHVMIGWWTSSGWRAGCGLLPLASELFDERVVPGNDEDAERGCHQHSEEHSGAHYVLGTGACTARLHQWNHAEDESEGGHQNRTKT